MTFDEFSMEHSSEAGGNEELLREMFDVYIEKIIECGDSTFSKINAVVFNHCFEIADDATYDIIESELRDIGVDASCIRDNSPDIAINFTFNGNKYNMKLNSHTKSIHTQGMVSPLVI